MMTSAVIAGIFGKRIAGRVMFNSVANADQNLVGRTCVPYECDCLVERAESLIAGRKRREARGSSDWDVAALRACIES